MIPSNPDLHAEFLARKVELERALAYNGGTHTLDDVWDGIQEGDLQLWCAEHSVIVTQILQAPQCRILFFFLAAGRMDELQALYPMIMAWGKTDVGCTRAMLSGRPGWARSFLSKDGWTASHVQYLKEM